MPLQSLEPAGHSQAPELQIRLLPQSVQPEPQAVGSIWVNLQVPEQLVRPVAQMHALPVQTSPTPQTVPHALQLALLVAVSTHITGEEPQPVNPD